MAVPRCTRQNERAQKANSPVCADKADRAPFGIGFALSPFSIGDSSEVVRVANSTAYGARFLTRPKPNVNTKLDVDHQKRAMGCVPGASHHCLDGPKTRS